MNLFNKPPVVLLGTVIAMLSPLPRSTVAESIYRYYGNKIGYKQDPPLIGSRPIDPSFQERPPIEKTRPTPPIEPSYKDVFPIYIDPPYQERPPYQELPPPTIDLSNNEVKNRAKAIAVKINRRNMLERGWKTEGTGVIIARDGGTYYVLTAKHVVKEKKSYQIEAPDGKIYMVSDSKITKLDGMDLAVLHFDSTENNNCFFMCYYEVARIGHFGKQTGRIYVFGWSKRDKNFKFTNMEMVNPRYRGQEVADSDGRSSVGRDPLDNGYSLLYKANRVEGQTEPGMSGGPILDNSGHLIGIHRAAHAFQGSLGIPSMIIFNQLPSNIRGLMQLSDAFAAEIPQ